MAHIHAELMAQYAEDAKKYNEPWKMWRNGNGDTWSDCTSHPFWLTTHVYRRKPRTIKIAQHEVPEPVRKPLSRGQKFWVVSPFRGPDSYTWVGDKEDFFALDSGFVHLSKEAATQYYEVLKILLSGTTEENL